YLSNDALFKIQSNIIRKLASEKSCLFVGRCADYILRDHPYSMTIFISSYMHDRMKRLYHTLNLSETEVKELIHKTDKCRSEYYNYYTYNTWGAAATYHLCINASVLGIEGTVTFIKEVLGMWVGKTESASFWMGVLTDLKARGVEDILITVTDNLNGFTDTIHPNNHI
ncbi:Cytidylate kinase, partial [termite gut metagenome]